MTAPKQDTLVYEVNVRNTKTGLGQRDLLPYRGIRTATREVARLAKIGVEAEIRLWADRPEGTRCWL